MLWSLSAANAAGAAPEAAAAPPDTSQWKCESCPFEKGASGAVSAGAAYVSKDSAKFGEYTGLERKGGYFVGDAEVRYRAPDAVYLDGYASDLGLRSRSLGLEGGRQGQYKLLLRYDQIPHFIADTAQTPFLGTGGALLALPQGFPAPTTAQMPLAATLHDVDLDTERKAVGVGAVWNGWRNWEYAVSVRHEKKEGAKRSAGAFFVNAAQLVEPVDYTTDQVDASISYAGARWQAKLGYYASIFRNDNSSLTWQNPFAFPSGVSGQLALAPGNEFHQIRAAAGYQLSDRTRATADVAYGRMTQDEGFLPFTLNPALALSPLPRGSLDARANTLDANVKLAHSVNDRLGMTAAYAHNERDNDTPQALYAWVTTDTFAAATPRVNLPYSFKQDKVKLAVDYRPLPRTKGTLGVNYDRVERTYQEVDTTRETTVWGKVSSRPIEILDASLKLAHGERDISGYHAVPTITPPENPLLRKYNMADRTRDSAALRADIAATEKVNVGLGASASRDSYTNSTIGLTTGSDLALEADVAVAVTEDISAHVFASHEQIKSRQVGSQSFSSPDWLAHNRDTIDLVGVGLRHALIKDKLDVGVDYRWLRTRSEIDVDTGVVSRFPDMTVAVQGVRLYATYRLNPKVRLSADWWYERYRSANWLLDNVTPATIPNVLTFGEQPPRYSVNVLRLFATYEF